MRGDAVLGEQMREEKMDWKELEAELAGWMRGFSGAELVFTAGWQSIPGLPADGFRADGVLTDGDSLIALEVEVKQSHPDTNVGKYWLLSDRYPYRRMVLFHVYTPGFNSYGWRMKLGEFYAAKMMRELPFDCVLLDKRAASSCKEALVEVQSVMEPKILEFFGAKDRSLDGARGPRPTAPDNSLQPTRPQRAGGLSSQPVPGDHEGAGAVQLRTSSLICDNARHPATAYGRRGTKPNGADPPA